MLHDLIKPTVRIYKRKKHKDSGRSGRMEVMEEQQPPEFRENLK